MGETKYFGKPSEKFSVDRELGAEYGKMAETQQPVSAQIPAHVDATKGTAKVSLGYVCRVMERCVNDVVSETPSRARTVPFSELGAKEQQYFGLPELEAALAAEPEAAYHGAASEGDLEAVQLRTEHGDTYLLHTIKEDDDEAEEAKE